MQYNLHTISYQLCEHTVTRHVQTSGEFMVHKVLILTADAGFGHRKAAQALETAFKRAAGDKVKVEIGNALQDPDIPDLVRAIETGYDESVLDDPTLYQLTYNATDAPMVVGLIQEVITTVLIKAMTRLVEKAAPDVIVNTYPVFTQAAIRAVRECGRAVPLD